MGIYKLFVLLFVLGLFSGTAFAATPPVVTLNSPASGYLTNLTTVTLNYTVVDDNQTEVNCTTFVDDVSVNNSLATNNTAFTYDYTTAAGFHQWNVSCTNNVTVLTGNSSINNFTADLSAPTINLNSPADAYLGNDTSTIFNFTALDDFSSIINCSLYLDGALNETNATTLNNTATTFTKTLATGNHSWYITCIDQANNSHSTSARTLLIDRDAPAITLNSPADAYLGNDTSTTFNFTAFDDFSSTINCSLYLDGALNETNATTLNNTATTFTKTLATGNHSWYITCIDQANNSNTSATRTLDIDQSAPAITLNSPADSYLGNDTSTTFNFTVTDDFSSTINCSFYLDGDLNETNATTTNNTATTYIKTLSTGNHSWYVTCVDQANNSNTSATRTLDIDRSPPTITLNSPANGYTVTSSGPRNITFNFSASDDNSATLNVTFYLDGVANYSNASFANGTSIELTRTLAIGTHNWSVTAIDGASNSNSSETRTLTIHQYIPSSSTDSKKNIYLSVSQLCPNKTIEVTTMSGTSPIISANIRLIHPITFDVVDKTTDTNGIAIFSATNVGEYKIIATKSGYKNSDLIYNYIACSQAVTPEPVIPEPVIPEPTTGTQNTTQNDTTTPDPLIAQSTAAIDGAQSEIDNALSAGKDVTEAEAKLAEAVAASAAGNYQEALDLANEAKKLAMNAKAPPIEPTKPPAQPSEPSEPATTEQPDDFSGFLMLLILLLLVGGGAALYYFFGMKKK